MYVNLTSTHFPENSWADEFPGNHTDHVVIQMFIVAIYILRLGSVCAQHKAADSNYEVQLECAV